MISNVADLLGALLGNRFKIVAKLGEGGMGYVFKAWDRHLKTDVVVKIPRPAALQNQDVVKRFGREIRSLVRLAHPHVVTILDVGEQDDFPYAVMQYLAGGNLQERRPRGPDDRFEPMPAASLSTWLQPIATALDFIHSQGYIHRDVKPANILFDKFGHVYLSDFGVAKALAALTDDAEKSSLTGAGEVLGTPGYMAPEMIGGLKYDGRADQYALAVMVYELLAGKSPFAGLSLPSILVRQSSGEVAPLCEKVPSASPALTAVIQKAMTVQPEQRYPNCLAFAQALLAAAAASSAPTAALVGGLVVAPPEPAKPVCPVCKKKIKVDPNLAGKRIRCSACSSSLQVAPDLRSFQVLEPGANVGLRLECPACRQVIRFHPKLRGKPFPCPRCRVNLTLAPDFCSLVPAAPGAETLAMGHLPTGLNMPVPRPRVQPRRKSKKGLLVLALLLLLLIPAGVYVYLTKPWLAWAPPSPPPGKQDVVTGKITIDFNSRKKADPDALDIYTVDLLVALAGEPGVRYDGQIKRAPRKAGRQAPANPPGLSFQLALSREAVGASPQILGQISGLVPFTDEGRYLFSDLNWTNALGVAQKSGGKVQGKTGPQKEPREVVFEKDGKTITYMVKRPDPLIFHDLSLPGYGALNVSPAVINGELTYNYDTGSYLTNKLKFKYGEQTDLVQGTILWKKDADYLTNGKSEYIVNLVFRPHQPKDGAAGDGRERFTGAEKDLMTVDSSMSVLSGSIHYEDRGERVVEDGETVINPHTSVVTYDLHANRLNANQVHTFLTLWLLMSGPVNDE